MNSLEKTIAELVELAKSTKTASDTFSPDTHAAEKARARVFHKLAAALRDMPDPEPTYEDVYNVKKAFCG